MHPMLLSWISPTHPPLVAKHGGGCPWWLQFSAVLQDSIISFPLYLLKFSYSRETGQDWSTHDTLTITCGQHMTHIPSLVVNTWHTYLWSASSPPCLPGPPWRERDRVLAAFCAASSRKCWEPALNIAKHILTTLRQPWVLEDQELLLASSPALARISAGAETQTELQGISLQECPWLQCGHQQLRIN